MNELTHRVLWSNALFLGSQLEKLLLHAFAFLCLNLVVKVVKSLLPPIMCYFIFKLRCETLRQGHCYWWYQTEWNVLCPCIQMDYRTNNNTVSLLHMLWLNVVLLDIISWCFSNSWLRWLIMVFSIFQCLYFDGSVLALFIGQSYNNGMRQMPYKVWLFSCHKWSPYQQYNTLKNFLFKL